MSPPSLRMTWAVLAALGALAAAPGRAAAQDRKSVAVDIQQPFAEVSMRTGYVPVVVRLHNTGSERAGLTVRAEVDHGSGADCMRRIELAAGESAEIELPVPRFTATSCSITVHSDREGNLATTGLRYGPMPPAHASGGGDCLAEAKGRVTPFLHSILVVRSEEPSLKGLKSLYEVDPTRTAGTYSSYSPYGSVAPMASWVPPTALPRSWICLLGLDLIVLDAVDFSRLDPPRREAVSTYAESGGFLLLTGSSRISDKDWDRLLPALQSRSGGIAAPCGLGTVVLQQADAFDADAKFGTEGDPWVRLLAGVVGGECGRFSAYHRLGVKTRNEEGGYRRSRPAVRIPGLGGTPVLAFAILVIVFAILAGPVNFTVLSILKKRALAVLTIPAVSGVTLVLLTIYAFAGEGFAVKVVPRTFTWLDQKTHRAVAVSLPGYYAGLPPAGGLRFDADSAPLPALGPSEDRYSYYRSRDEEEEDRNIDWTGGARLVSGWVPARTPSEFLLVQCGPCRQRLQVGKPVPEGLPVTNGLEATLEIAVFGAREKGRVRHYWIRNLAAGATAFAAAASPEPDRPEPRFKGPIQSLLRSYLPPEVEESWEGGRLTQIPPPGDGMYAAVADRSIFATVGVEKPDLLEGMHLIRGRLGAEGE